MQSVACCLVTKLMPAAAGFRFFRGLLSVTNIVGVALCLAGPGW